jgi:hypothetical protein
MSDQQDIEWFNQRGFWLLRKVPGTKDTFYVVGSVQPPDNIKRIYNIGETE